MYIKLPLDYWHGTVPNAFDYIQGRINHRSKKQLLLPFLCLDEMKRHYSNPNKTSFAYFASGEVTLLQSFTKYALGKSSGLPQRCMFEQFILHLSTYQRPIIWKKSRQKVLRVFLLVIHSHLYKSTALPWDFYFFKVTQPLTVSTLNYCTLKWRKEETLTEKQHTLPYGLRNPYRNPQVWELWRLCPETSIVSSFGFSQFVSFEYTVVFRIKYWCFLFDSTNLFTILLVFHLSCQVPA